MSTFKIGIIADSFRLPIREGIKRAAELGADGVQIYANGEMSPDNMSADDRVEFKAYCAELGLEVSALCGDLGGFGFERREENAAKIEQTNRITELAVDVGTTVVTTHIGVVPEDESCETYKAMVDALHEMGEFAVSKGVTLAIETGPEPAVRLAKFIKACDSKGVGVNFDPANLAMVCNDDVVAGAKLLAPYIVHTHAKDGTQHQPCDPAEVYHAFASGGFDALIERMGDIFTEMPLGEGSVPWDEYLSALKDEGFSGYLTIEREVGDNPAEDISKAVKFLEKKIS